VDNVSGHAHTEDRLVEQHAIGLCAALGWQTDGAIRCGLKQIVSLRLLLGGMFAQEPLSVAKALIQSGRSVVKEI
jgi:hypothetical protein